jgi:hypothetical protein
MPSILQRSDYEDYLILLYFGRDDDYLSLCQRRAYRDLQRTLHGIGGLQGAGDARNQAVKVMTRMFTAIRVMDVTQEKFDDWHRASCAELKAIYKKRGYGSFYVGQAQKWLNMTFKYLYMMGEQRLPGFSHLYDFCHVPLDQILIDALRKYGFRPIKSWSRLNDYEVYLDRQRWVRNQFRLIPLDVEFYLWMGRPLPSDVQS